LTGFLVLMGIGEFVSDCCFPVYRACWLLVRTALPTVLAHCGYIGYPAMAMSILGGLLIYGTIISFSTFFQEQEEF
jgi:hypothetical protein